jgi:hypothetical protein
MSDGRVIALFLSRSGNAGHERVQKVRATSAGLEGERHSSVNSPRQILLQSLETLRDFDLEPGDVYENVLIDGLQVNELAEGLRFQLGTATVEITIPCEPCSQMDRLREGLRKAIDGKRGRFVRVVSEGEIRVGDRMLAL